MYGPPHHLPGDRDMRRFLLAAALLSTATAVRADCICECVNGAMQPVCSSSIDVPPICPPRVCPIAPPSIPPIDPPVVPPVGTSDCRSRRVCDEWGHCTWRMMCE